MKSWKKWSVGAMALVILASVGAVGAQQKANSYCPDLIPVAV